MSHHLHLVANGSENEGPSIAPPLLPYGLRTDDKRNARQSLYKGVSVRSHLRLPEWTTGRVDSFKQSDQLAREAHNSTRNEELNPAQVDGSTNDEAMRLA